MTKEIKVTFILKNLSAAFYQGYGESIPSFDTLTEAEKFTKLSKMAKQTEYSGFVKMKVGTGQFNQLVDLNAMLRNPGRSFTYTLENRRGYRLATFIVTG